tara:strand:- start:23602 stop:24651 length:1050 start_codon:yes stop_codon:yes gene_type:complete
MNNVLFIGSLSSCQGTGRYESFVKLFGSENVNYFEPYKLLSSLIKKYEMAFYYKFGASKKVDIIINNHLASIYKEKYFKFIWIETPELFGINTLKFLKERSKYLHLYGNDNPFEGKQKRRFKLFHSSINYYSSMCFMRVSSVINAKELSKANIFREYWSYPEFIYNADQNELTNQDTFEKGIYMPGAVFIGTNIPGCNRKKFLKDISRSINSLDIYGNKWGSQNSCFPCKIYKEAINEKYIKAIQSRRVNIIMLNKNNLDTSTTRSVEVPAFKGLGIYPPTDDHEFILGKKLKKDLTYESKYELVEKINLLSLEKNKFLDNLLSLNRRIKKLKLSSYDSILRQLKTIDL